MMPLTCPGSVISLGLVRSKRGLIALLVGLAWSVSVIIGAQAATIWTVCASGCDYTSLKAAIAAPTTVDGDTLAIAAGTYTEPGIVVNKSLTLQGEDMATTIVQAATTPGTASDRVFTIPSGVTATIRGLTIRHGRITDDEGEGGGLANRGRLTVTHSTIRGNRASYAGGLVNRGTVTVTHSTIRGNRAPRSWGGGLSNIGLYTLPPSTISHSTISGNTGYNGGGVFNNGPLTIRHSTISGNAAVGGNPGGGVGGGIANGGRLTLTHSTVSGNTAVSDGGGLDNSGGTLTLTHSTVSGNASDSRGGGLFHRSEGSGILVLTNSLVAKNPAGGDCSLSSDPAETISEGYNLDSDGSCQLTAATDQPGVDPLLGPLQDNGGRTFTHALLPGSPAIDAIPWDTNGCGTTHIDDQRGQARPQPAGGACDIGAYEVEVDG